MTMPDKPFSIRLPSDHPLWNYPPGQRSQKTREAIDLGLNLAGVLNEIKVLVTALDSRLDRLEKMMTTGAIAAQNEKPEEDVSVSIENFDIDAFTEL